MVGIVTPRLRSLRRTGLQYFVIAASGRERRPVTSVLCEGHLDGANPAVTDTKLRGATAFTAIALAVGGCHFGRVVGKSTRGLPTGGRAPAASLGASTSLLVIVLKGTESQPMTDLANVIPEERPEMGVRAYDGEHIGRRTMLRVGCDAQVVERIIAQRQRGSLEARPDGSH